MLPFSHFIFFSFSEFSAHLSFHSSFVQNQFRLSVITLRLVLAQLFKFDFSLLLFLCPFHGFYISSFNLAQLRYSMLLACPELLNNTYACFPFLILYSLSNQCLDCFVCLFVSLSPVPELIWSVRKCWNVNVYIWKSLLCDKNRFIQKRI